LKNHKPSLNIPINEAHPWNILYNVEKTDPEIYQCCCVVGDCLSKKTQTILLKCSTSVEQELLTTQRMWVHFRN
jgi:hypothetical protein